MERDPISVIREVRASLTAWLDVAHKLPDPSAHPPGTVKKISDQIKRVEAAIRAAGPALKSSNEWKHEIAEYAQILGELRARLGNFEMALRIRQDQARGKHAKLSIARSWSDLAKHIG
ncbi:MAG TPA: hypothetical protein VMB47_05095 [Candidatus Aquilonibacter sp.]|nr:hypothetical protein [Candidatus Aquilonibacter sp.]